MRLYAAGEEVLALNQGTDEELTELRQHLPEPSRVDVPYVKAAKRPLVPQLQDCCWSMTMQEWIQTETFERYLVQSAEGATFWAWRALRDGRIYL